MQQEANGVLAREALDELLVAGGAKRGRDDRQTVQLLQEFLMERVARRYRAKHQGPAVIRRLEPLEGPNILLVLRSEGDS